MIADAKIAALRGDDTPQRHSQRAFKRAMDDWLALEATAQLQGDLKAFAKGAELADCASLSAIYSPQGPVLPVVVESFLAIHLGLMQTDGQGHLALRHSYDGSKSTLLLGQEGDVTLSLIAHDGTAFAKTGQGAGVPKVASFTPSDMWDVILAGNAEAERISLLPSADGPSAPAQFRRELVTLAKGDVWRANLRQETQFYRSMSGALVRLSLQRRQTIQQPLRSYELDSGKLVHQAASDPLESRHQIMLSLLGRMGRSDAAPLMAEIALGEGEKSLRWEALREVLAMDTALGFTALVALAARVGDPLNAPAGALRAQLLAQYPQLTSLVQREAELCPA